MAGFDDIQERTAQIKEAYAEIDTSTNKYVQMVEELRRDIRRDPDLMAFLPYINECLKMSGSLTSQLKRFSYADRLLARIQTNVQTEKADKERLELRSLQAAKRKDAKTRLTNVNILPPTDTSFDEVYPDGAD